MVLIARKGLRSGAVLAEFQPSATRDSSDPAPMSGHGVHHCAVAIFGSRTPQSEWIFDLHQPSKPIVRYHHCAGCARRRDYGSASTRILDTHL
jgi:hypothetical protein